MISKTDDEDPEQGSRRRRPKASRTPAAKIDVPSAAKNHAPMLSIVVPIYNERDSIDPFLERLESVLADIDGVCETIMVDDGSTDDSLEHLIAQRDRNPFIKIITFSRNFGKDIALTAGLDHANGDAVVVIDVDLEEPPELIGEMVARWRDGYEVVYAARRSRRKDSFTKRLTARWFYKVHNALADLELPADAGDYRLMDRRVVEALRRLPEHNRFMKGLMTWVGFRQTAVHYDREARTSGKTGWSYWRLWNFALDAITSFSTIPLRIWSYVGAGIAALAFVFALFLIVRTLILGVDVPGYASLMVVVLLLGGLNLLTLGVIGEYLGRTYLEAKARPLYLVRETFGFDGDTREG
jgi:glycosyltransferase involved in cell wall biosynthesis